MTRHRKRWLFLCAVLVALSLLAVGCGGEKAPSTTQAQAPDTTAAPQQPGPETTAPPATEAPAVPTEAIELKYAEQNAESAWSVQNATKPWLKEIEEATKGKVKIKTFYGETLSKGKDQWESLKAGVVDFGWAFHGYWAGMTSLADVINLPFMPADNAEQSSEVLWQLYEEFPAMREQFKDNHILTLWTSSPYYLLTTKKAVRSFDDMKGLKIRTIGGPPTDLVAAMGGVPIAMGMPDTYQALQTGVIDGILASWEPVYSFRHYEVCRYMTVVPFHVVYYSQAFGKQKWDSLPADVQEGFTSVSGLEGAKFWGRNMSDSAAVAAKEMLEKEGKAMEYIEIPADQVEKAREQFARPLWEEWVKKQEADGHAEARQILDRAVELLTKGS